MSNLNAKTMQTTFVKADEHNTKHLEATNLLLQDSANTVTALPAERFQAACAAVVNGFINEIEQVMEERKALRKRIRSINTRAQAMGLSPKLIRKAAALRDVSSAELHQEQELLDLYRAADAMMNNEKDNR